MAGAEDKKQAIRDYWEKQDTISIIDEHLHRIEIDTASLYLQPSHVLADIGCGNGEATVEYGRKVASVVAIERSDQLRGMAEAAVKREGLDNVKVQPGDVLALDFEGDFDAVVTQRMIINMESWEDQQTAIMSVHRALKPGGTFIMIENTNETFATLNEVRARVDLGPIKQHWHNRFFDREKLFEFMDGKFLLLEEHDFSLYYFLTRVYTQMFASFEGFGAGAKKDPLFKVSDKAARKIYEEFKDRISFEDNMSTIQCFAFRREE